jgi:hypothetical protein
VITRREFLVRGCAGLGAWLIGADIAQRIVRAARENNRPHLVEVTDPDCILYANDLGDEYLFTLGQPYSEEVELTWRDWLERKGVDVSSRKEIREYFFSEGLWNPDFGERFKAPKLDAQVSSDILQEYLEEDYLLYDAPATQAYQFLIDLDLDNHRAQGRPLGKLHFIDGPCPGNNAYLVTTKSVETIGGLQQRLLQLGHLVEIRTVDCDPESL